MYVLLGIKGEIEVNWIDYDIRLITLWNAIAGVYSKTVSYNTSEQLSKEALELMKWLTEELKELNKLRSDR